MGLPWLPGEISAINVPCARVKNHHVSPYHAAHRSHRAADRRWRGVRPGHRHLRRSQARFQTIRHADPRPPRRGAAACAHRKNGAARAVGGAGRCVARAAHGAGAERRQALLRAQRRGLARRLRRRLGQSVGDENPWCFDAEHAAGGPARRGLARRCRGSQPGTKNRPDGFGAAAGIALAQGPDSGGLFESGAVSRRDGRH